ncbi:hypothetical protein OESDEN_09834 [Oesophagostomum dentatum]|uniref:GST C-terminal domain-containing protein n=1 Tax=Oesophagostomum dentatum TaxID=61180 RepID=A0A0B1T4J1_OESDE|nr:hypothetical protein OESDEN_09834 [Oesophagostomum dentatum]
MMLRDLGCPEVLSPLLTPLMALMIRGKIEKRIVAGVGKLSSESYKDILKKDYDACQTLLGQQKYLFGDRITAADCTVFGHIAAILYFPANNYVKDLLKESYPTLVDYCNRVRDTVFGKEFTLA